MKMLPKSNKKVREKLTFLQILCFQYELQETQTCAYTNDWSFAVHAEVTVSTGPNGINILPYIISRSVAIYYEFLTLTCKKYLPDGRTDRQTDRLYITSKNVSSRNCLLLTLNNARPFMQLRLYLYTM